ncbi:MAG TPA: CBS domain-containing protein [Pseudonocardiaceae bacterium]|jgi:hypothetical protein|nr:CBS domain-containing protein [Pseudonocardiaceae bacterium]
MISRELRSVPVVDEDRLVGIITHQDLVRTIARDALIAADVRKRLSCYGIPDRWTAHVAQASVTITDQYADPADHHVALVLAQAVPGVVHAQVVHSARSGPDRHPRRAGRAASNTGFAEEVARPMFLRVLTLLGPGRTGDESADSLPLR